LKYRYGDARKLLDHVVNDRQLDFAPEVRVFFIEDEQS
jgi:hypothetical protein